MKKLIIILIVLILSGCKQRQYLMKLEVVLISGSTQNFTVVGNGDFIDFYQGCIYNIQPQICGVSTYKVINSTVLPD